jgi:ribosomal peptide maturation radical SAM protein 1
LVLKIVLAVMPWHLLDTPCLPVGLLRARIAACAQRHEVVDYYGNLAWAEFLCQQSGGGSADFPRFTVDDYAYVADWGVWHAMGEWIFAGALYGDPEWRMDAYREYLGARKVNPGRSFEMRRCASAFADLAADQILAPEPDLVGFTTTFQQNVASLAVARRLKQRRPDLVVVFGGGNVHGPMGPAVHRNFPFVDYVVNGEGEIAIVGLLDALASGGPLDRIPGLSWRRPDGSTVSNGPAGLVPMSAVPRPDYTGWQYTFERSPLRPELKPVLLYEAARGCWWGEKHHCTFCGLNGTTMKFRAKPAEEVWDDLLHLVRTHRILDIVTVDNILDQAYLHDLLPRLRDADLDLLIRYEVKANLRAEHLALLRDAGVRHIQPGIESLSTPVLRLMDKGVHATQNVQVLRDADDHEITVDWNWLYGFPGETPDDYDPVVEQLPALVHLQPPSGTVRIILERFSPYFQRPELGFQLRRPAPMYDNVYDLPRGELMDLCYQFDTPPQGLTDEQASGLRSAVTRWRNEHHGSCLVCEPDPGGLLLVDARRGWPRQEFPIREQVWAHAYRALARPRSVAGLTNELTGLGYRVDDAAVRGWVAQLRECGLVFIDDHRVVALATERQPLRFAQWVFSKPAETVPA